MQVVDARAKTFRTVQPAVQVKDQMADVQQQEKSCLTFDRYMEKRETKDYSHMLVQDIY